MLLLPIPTPLLRSGDDLASVLIASAVIQQNDILVVSSKALATVENSFIDLPSLVISEDAEKWSQKTGRSQEFCQAILQETQRLHGSVIGDCPGVMVTEVRPQGLEEGSIITANAGLDESNVPDGTTIGWPNDPAASAKNLRAALENKLPNGSHIAVIVSDSSIRPRRKGVVAFALTVSGMDPLRSEVGRADLFGHPLRITHEAIADQLATAANFLMGNADQCIPAAIIRDHGLSMTDYEGWVPGIEPDEDMFRGIV